MAAYAAFRTRDYRFLLAGNVLWVLGSQMLSTVVGWDLYQATRSPLTLGNVGLVQIVPVLLLTFAAGHVADRYDRRRTLVIAQSIVALTGFVLASAGSRRGVTLIYSCLFLSALARTFQFPAASSLLPKIVPMEHLSNAISWNGMGREIATMTGPALAGLLLAWLGSSVVYLSQAVISILTVICYASLKRPGLPEAASDKGGLRAVGEGIRFVFREKLVLGAMSLDLLAVLFGGATALLPIFAVDILHIGPRGLGWLRAAPRSAREHGVLAGASSSPEARRSDAAVGGLRIRRGHHWLRAVAVGMAVVRIIGGHRGAGQRKRSTALLPGPLAHSRFFTRAGERGERVVHQLVKSMGRGGIGTGRPVVGDGSFGGVRRRGDGGGRGSCRHGIPKSAALAKFLTPALTYSQGWTKRRLMPLPNLCAMAAEQVAANAVELFHLVVESAPNAIVVVDQGGEIKLLNALTEQLFGYSREELLGKSVEILLPGKVRDGHAEKRAAFARCPHARMMGAGRDLSARHKDGSEFPVEIGLSPAQTANGLFIVAMIVDITARKCLEQELRAAREHAEAAARAKSGFLAAMSHEIRTPMNGIIGMANLLAATTLDSEQQEYATTIVDSADCLLTILNDILDYSKIEAGHLQIESREFDLRTAVQGTLSLLAARAAEKGWI